jgi:hypothetical protein
MPVWLGGFTMKGMSGSGWSSKSLSEEMLANDSLDKQRNRVERNESCEIKNARRAFRLSHTYMVAGWLHLPLAGPAPVGGAVRIAKRMNLDAYFPGLM